MVQYGPDNSFSKFKEKLSRAAIETYGDLGRLRETAEYCRCGAGKNGLREIGQVLMYRETNRKAATNVGEMCDIMCAYSTETPLCIVLYENSHMEIAQVLMYRGVKQVATTNVSLCWGEMCAVIQKYTYMKCKYVRKCGIQCDLQYGDTPLHCAVEEWSHGDRPGH